MILLNVLRMEICFRGLIFTYYPVSLLQILFLIPIRPFSIQNVIKFNRFLHFDLFSFDLGVSIQFSPISFFLKDILIDFKRKYPKLHNYSENVFIVTLKTHKMVYILFANAIKTVF